MHKLHQLIAFLFIAVAITTSSITYGSTVDLIINSFSDSPEITLQPGDKLAIHFNLDSFPVSITEEVERDNTWSYCHGSGYWPLERATQTLTVLGFSYQATDFSYQANHAGVEMLHFTEYRIYEHHSYLFYNLDPSDPLYPNNGVIRVTVQ